MISINITTVIILIIAALIGFLLGFGKVLKFSTRGILGVAISIIVCVMVGGTIKNIGAIRGLIERADLYFAELWKFLGVLHIGTVIYYVCLFAVIQIIRIVIVKTICRIDKSDNKGVKIASKIFGTIFVPAFCLGLCLLGLAGLKIFENSEFTVNLLAKIDGSFLMALYQNNPIVF